MKVYMGLVWIICSLTALGCELDRVVALEQNALVNNENKPDGESSENWEACTGRIVVTNDPGDEMAKAWFRSLDSYEDGGTIAAGRFHQNALFPIEDGDPIVFNDHWNALFLLRSDANGKTIWAKKITEILGGLDDEVINVLATDDGGVIVYGMAALEPTQEALDANKDGEEWWFLERIVAKLDADGNILWQVVLSGSRETHKTNMDPSLAATIGPDGNVWVAGTFVGALVVNPGQPNEAQYGEAETRNSVALKLDQDGTVEAAIELEDLVYPTSLDVRDDHMLLVADSHQDRVYLFDSQGEVVWYRTHNGHGFAYRTRALFSSNDTIIVAGQYKGKITLKDEAGTEISFTGPPLLENESVTISGGTSFVAAYREDGTLLWADSPQCKDLRNCAVADGDGMILHPDGGIYIVGMLSGQSTLGMHGDHPTQIGTTKSSGYDPNRMFIARYDSNGVLTFAKETTGQFIDEQPLAALRDSNTLVIGKRIIDGTAVPVKNEDDLPEVTGESDIAFLGYCLGMEE